MLTSFFSLPSFFFSLSLFSPSIQNFHTCTPTLMSFCCPYCCLSLPLSCLLMYASSCYFIFPVPDSEAHLPAGQFFCKLATLKMRMSYYSTAVCIYNYLWTTFHRRKVKNMIFLKLWNLKKRLISMISENKNFNYQRLLPETHTYE